MTKASMDRKLRRHKPPADGPMEFEITPLEAAELRVVDLLRQNVEKTAALLRIEHQQELIRWVEGVSARVGVSKEDLLSRYNFDAQTRRATPRPGPDPQHNGNGGTEPAPRGVPVATEAPAIAT